MFSLITLLFFPCNTLKLTSILLYLFQKTIMSSKSTKPAPLSSSISTDSYSLITVNPFNRMVEQPFTSCFLALAQSMLERTSRGSDMLVGDSYIYPSCYFPNQIQETHQKPPASIIGTQSNFVTHSF